jgi:cytochrome P450
VSTPPVWPEEEASVGRAIREDFLGFLTRVAHTLGPVARFDHDGHAYVLVAEPDLAHQILAARFDEVTIGPAMEAERPVFGNGILLNYSDSWRPRRERIQRHLSARGVQRFGDMMIRRAVRQFSGFGKEIDVGHEMLALTLGVVVEALFSQEADRALPTIESLVSAHHRYFERVVTGSAPSGNGESLTAAVQDMHALVNSMIEERRARASPGDDLFGALLTCTDDAGEPLEDETIRDEAITLLLPGHETTATTLTWAISLLGRNPDVLASFERQIDDALDGKLPTVGVLTSIPLARQIILETLRLYPVVYFVDRTAARDIELGGYHVPKGTVFVLAQWLLHRDARFFSDPERFQPARFDADARRTMTKFSYFPFGGGPKICVGSHFALLEASLLLTAFVQRFDFDLLAQAEPEFWLTETLQPRQPVRVRLTQRAEATR